MIIRNFYLSIHFIIISIIFIVCETCDIFLFMSYQYILLYIIINNINYYILILVKGLQVFTQKPLYKMKYFHYYNNYKIKLLGKF